MHLGDGQENPNNPFLFIQFDFSSKLYNIITKHEI